MFFSHLKVRLKYETDEKPTAMEISKTLSSVVISKFSAFQIRTKFMYSVGVVFVAFLKRRQK